eukprot:gene3859-4810_t
MEAVSSNFDFLECTICLDEISEFAVPFSSNMKNGNKTCRHNFCSQCLQNFYENKKNKGELLSCPVCREEFDGYIQNRMANELLVRAKKFSSTTTFLKSEYSKLDQQNKESKVEIDNLRRNLNARIEELESDQQRSQTEIDQSRTRIRELDMELQLREKQRLKELESHQSKFDQQQQQLLKITQSNTELQEQCQSHLSRSNDQTQQIGQLQQQLQEYRQRCQMLDRSIQSIEFEKQSLTSRLTSNESNFERQLETTNQQIRTRDESIQQLTLQIRQLKQEVVQLNQRCESERAFFESGRDEVEKAAKRNRDMDGTIASLKVDMSRDKNTIEALTLKNRALQRELEEYKLSHNNSSQSSLSSYGSGPLSISNNISKLAGSSYNMIKSAGFSYFLGSNSTGNLKNDFILPFKNFTVYEKRGNNKNSQIFRVSLKSIDINYILKFIPYSQPTGFTSIYYAPSDQDLTVFRESMLLYKLNHQNILKLEAVTKDESTGKIYSVISPFVPKDLEFVLAENNSISRGGANHQSSSSQQLLLSDIKYILYQIISAVSYLHSQDLVHRDLKPTSILLFGDHQVKLCSFGLCCSVLTSYQNHFSSASFIPTNNNNSSSSYLSPELLFHSIDPDGAKTHHKHLDWKAIDMWAIGCIFLELLFKKRLFVSNNQLSHHHNNSTPNNNQQQQINNNNLLILSSIINYSECSPRDFEFFTKQNIALKINPNKKLRNEPSPFEISSDTYDLLCQLLQFDPTSRIKSSQALHHKFFSNEPYYICEQPSRNDISSTLTDLNIKDFIKDKCTGLI